MSRVPKCLIDRLAREFACQEGPAGRYALHRHLRVLNAPLKTIIQPFDCRAYITPGMIAVRFIAALQIVLRPAAVF